MHKLLNFFLLLLILALMAVFGYKYISPQKDDVIAVTSFNGQVENDKLKEQVTQNLIKDYLLSNPEVVMQAIERFYSKNNEEKENFIRLYLKDNKEKIEDINSYPVIGDMNASETIVYLYDYKCHYCKIGYQALNELRKDFPDVKIILRPLPLIDAESYKAASIILAVARVYPEHVLDIHNEMLNTPYFNEQRIDGLFKKYNIDSAAVLEASKTNEITILLDKTKVIANNLSTRGVPVYIIKDKLFNSAMNIEQLKELFKKETD